MSRMDITSRYTRDVSEADNDGQFSILMSVICTQAGSIPSSQPTADVLLPEFALMMTF